MSNKVFKYCHCIASTNSKALSGGISYRILVINVRFTSLFQIY